MTTEPDRTREGGDFDFLIGSWKVHHRKLNSRLSGCTDWTETNGTSTVRPIMGGLANVDDNVIEGPDGTYRACSFRVFNRETRRWSIWWFDSRSPGRLDPPVVGQFEDGVGTFYSDDSFEGKPIRVRFIWSHTRTDSPRWEQAFSTERAGTWETNWTMQFIRLAADDAPASR
jgi:hypothetical protein